MNNLLKTIEKYELEGQLANGMDFVLPNGNLLTLIKWRKSWVAASISVPELLTATGETIQDCLNNLAGLLRDNASSLRDNAQEFDNLASYLTQKEN